MSTLNLTAQSEAADLARECVYRFLPAVVAGPYSANWENVLGAENRDLAIHAWHFLHPDSDGLEMSYLVEQLDATPAVLRDQYDSVFGLVVPKECPPYETEYYPTHETFGRSQQMADVAGFYRAFGIEQAQASPERPDYLALELEFMAFLLLKRRLALAANDRDSEVAEQVEVCESALRDFFRDHLAWWLPAFVTGLRRKAGAGYLRALADVLGCWIPGECSRLDISAVLRPVHPETTESPEDQSGCAACPLHV
jgi:TorA maturation chaperone TorD